MEICDCNNLVCAEEDEMGFLLLTGHHPKCPKFDFNKVKVLKDLIKELVKGIEVWSNDEDGVHYDLWEAYKKAKSFLGEMNYKEHEGDNQLEKQKTLLSGVKVNLHFSDSNKKDNK